MRLHPVKHIALPLIVASIGAAIFLGSFFWTSKASAAVTTCPTTGTVESGTHCRFLNNGDSIHLWTPATYNKDNAAIVVYIHGDTSDEDATWDSDQLAREFRLSGVNAFFIVPEGPNCGGTGSCSRVGSTDNSVRWGKLADLLSTVEPMAPGGLPSGNIIVIGHSNAIRTTFNWASENHSRLTHIIGLDTMYASPSSYSTWIKQDGKKLTQIARSGTRGASLETVKAAGSGQFEILGLDNNNLPVSGFQVPAFADLTEKQKGIKALYIESVNYGHHDMPENIIHRILPRAVSTASGDPLSGVGSGIGTNVQSNLPLSIPDLEVPIPFVSFSEAVKTEDGSVISPFIGEYISGVYQFLVGIVGIVGAFMIMVGGYQYLTAAGNRERVAAARKRIVNALLGIVLAFGSYLILYTINPSLVSFEALQLSTVSTQLANEAKDEGGLISASNDAEASGRTVTGGGFPPLKGGRPTPVCSPKAKGGKPIACEDLCKQPRSSWPKTTPGAADPARLVAIGSGTGFTSSKGNVRGLTLDTTRELVVEAGRIAADTNRLRAIGVDGGPYRIHFSWGYRPIEFQIQLACDNMEGVLRGTIARPGGSLHGAGWALDTQLWDGDKLISRSGGSKAQQYTRWRDGAIKLAKIMFAAGFRRVQNEIWHFEPRNAPDPGCRCYSVQDCGFPASANSAYYQKLISSSNVEQQKLTDVRHPESPIGCGKTFNP